MAVILIGNPASGGSSLKKLMDVYAFLKSRSPDARLIVTEKRGDAERASREALGGQIERIIAAGGDGTCNEVINGIAGSTMPMAVLPMGTTNVLARELGVPMNLKDAVDRALTGNSHITSLGMIAFNGQTRYFSLMAGIGYDAEAVYGAGKSPVSGKASYVISGMKKLLFWSPGELNVKVDGGLYKAYSLIACNASKYAGDFRIALDADISEPLLHVFLMHGKRRLDILRYAGGIMTGRHLRLKDITYLPAARIEVAGTARMQIDGDYMGMTPAVIGTVPHCIRLVY